MWWGELSPKQKLKRRQSRWSDNASLCGCVMGMLVIFVTRERNRKDNSFGVRVCIPPPGWRRREWTKSLELTVPSHIPFQEVVKISVESARYGTACEQWTPISIYMFSFLLTRISLVAHPPPHFISDEIVRFVSKQYYDSQRTELRSAIRFIARRIICALYRKRIFFYQLLLDRLIV